jgi:hypothetical protein
LRGNTSHASNYQKPSYFKDSTIFKPLQVNFYVLPFKKPSKYFPFCDTIFSSRGRSGRICYLPDCNLSKKEKKGKKDNKKALLHGM